MASLYFRKFGAQCVPNSMLDPMIRHFALDESLSARMSHLFGDTESILNKSDTF